MEEQIQQFATVRRNITELLGSPKVVDDLLQKSIYLISIGSNDLVEYALTHSPSDSKQFIANLTQAYATHLTNLYNLGARKFAIIGIPPIGCCPAARVFNDTGGCLEVLNDGARLFYKSMQSLLTEFSLLFKV
ncbi:putative triacylglycerol lipase [Helianthus annuus]|nr:putative triacylglycerol lipase [Helianthus annuus]